MSILPYRSILPCTFRLVSKIPIHEHNMSQENDEGPVGGQWWYAISVHLYLYADRCLVSTMFNCRTKCFKPLGFNSWKTQRYFACKNALCYLHTSLWNKRNADIHFLKSPSPSQLQSLSLIIKLQLMNSISIWCSTVRPCVASIMRCAEISHHSMDSLSAKLLMKT